MRRLTPLLLALGLAVAVTACANTSSEAEVKSTTPGTGSVTTPGGSSPSTDDPGTTDTTEPDDDFSGSTLTEPPSGDFPDPELPPEPPDSATFADKILYDLTEAVVNFSGRTTAASTGSCSPEISQTAPAGSYTCTVDFEGESVDFDITVTGSETSINYEGGLVSGIPLTREKAEWEAAVFAGGDQALCDMEDFDSYETDTGTAFTCKATDSTDEVVDLTAEIARGGPEGGRLTYSRS